MTATYEKIATTTLGSAASDITFSSIGQLHRYSYCSVPNY
jgi:hypothetical protein